MPLPIHWLLYFVSVVGGCWGHYPSSLSLLWPIICSPTFLLSLPVPSLACFLPARTFCCWDCLSPINPLPTLHPLLPPLSSFYTLSSISPLIPLIPLLLACAVSQNWQAHPRWLYISTDYNESSTFHSWVKIWTHIFHFLIQHISHCPSLALSLSLSSIIT